MRNVFLMIFVLCVSWSPGRADNQPAFDFKVSVVEQTQADDVEVYGTFSAQEGQHGGIELAFFRDSGTYSIRAIESMGDVAAMPGGKTRRYDVGGIDIILRMFVSPMRTRDGNVHLTGTATLMENTSAADAPLYRIAEESFSEVVANGGETILTFTAKPSGREIRLKLAVDFQDSRRTISSRDDSRFIMSFSLFNEDDGRFEIEGEPCELEVIPSRQPDDPSCTHRRMFRLANEDSLLYLMTYHLDDVSQLDGGLIQITLTVERWFFVNPKRYFTAEVPEGVEGKTYGSGYRETRSTITIDGKKRRIEAEIDNGTVVGFKWDNILLTKSDIVRNWNDVVAILTQVEDQFLYRPPRLEGRSEPSHASLAQGLIKSPANYTGSKVTSTTYTKSFTLEPRQDAEIDIPLGRKSLLPFSAREVVRMSWGPGAGQH